MTTFTLPSRGGRGSDCVEKPGPNYLNWYKKRKNRQKMEQLNSYKLEKSPLLTSQAPAILKNDWY
jgi:hypothetical protein